MNRFPPRIVASFAVAILVVVTGWAGAGAITSGLRSRDQALKGRRALDSLIELERQLTAAETSLRGFLLTGNQDYLAGYQKVVAAGDLMAPVRASFAGDAEAAPLVDTLGGNVAAKREVMAETLQLYDHHDPQAAVERVRSGRGKRIMDALSGNLAELNKYERHVQEGHVAELLRTFRLARVVILSGTLLAFALAIIVNLSLASAFRHREQSQRQLQRSNEELDQFAYATSHDLKAPLRGITNLAGWIEEDLGTSLPPKVKEHLNLLRNRARRLEALIEGILAYSRAGRVREKGSRIDTRALVEEVIELLAPPESVQFDIGALPVIDTERVPLQQVFMNLLQNAIKHGCAAGGKIRIAAAEDTTAWTFSVADPGPGIAPQFQERVFGLFQTLAPRDRVEGAGIGLAVVRKLAESRGGSVALDSRPGAGATFRVRWPKESVT